MFRRGYAVLRCLCDGVAERLHRVDVRFTSPVYPGETVRTEIWRQERGIAAFRVRVDERDLIVLNNGRAEFQT